LPEVRHVGSAQLPSIPPPTEVLREFRYAVADGPLTCDENGRRAFSTIIIFAGKRTSSVRSVREPDVRLLTRHCTNAWRIRDGTKRTSSTRACRTKLNETRRTFAIARRVIITTTTAFSRSGPRGPVVGVRREIHTSLRRAFFLFSLRPPPAHPRRPLRARALSKRHRTRRFYYCYLIYFFFVFLFLFFLFVNPVSHARLFIVFQIHLAIESRFPRPPCHVYIYIYYARTI